jgi:hypothetical protein
VDYETLFPGRFLKSADLKGKDATVTIAGVKAEEVDDKEKAVLSFEGTKKQMVMNRTNAESIKLMFGRETDAWIGKRITLYPAVMKDPFSDGDITALRVRGSPDIDKPMTCEVKRGRKTLKISVRPTGNGKPAAKPVAPAAAKPNGKPVTAEPTDAEKAEIAEQERAAAAADGFPA